MSRIEVGRPKSKDVEKINEFFQIVLKDTFDRNGISDLIDTFLEEVEEKRRFLNEDLESDGKDRYFLIAKECEKIVGSIAYGPSNALINSCTNGKLKDVVEIGTVFVLPQYQGQGLGTRMLKLIFAELKKKGISEFCLDSGYKTAQKIWIKKFGWPQYHMKDYWGPGSDHMIWIARTDDYLG